MLTKIPSKILKKYKGKFHTFKYCIEVWCYCLEEEFIACIAKSPARPPNFSLRLMLLPKELLAELTSQTEAHISEDNPEAAGINVKMPRTLKISQPIRVNESISYRLQISKHNRTQSGWQRQTRRHRRKPEFVYENSEKRISCINSDTASDASIA